MMKSNQEVGKQPSIATKDKPGSNAAKTKKLPPIDTEKHFARLATSPVANAAAAIAPWSKLTYGESKNIDALISELQKDNARIHDGDMKTVEAMLFDQAQVLQVIFTNLTRRAATQEYLTQFQTYFNLGMKAQAQCRATLEALAEIKNPRQVAFVKQANIAGGNQQVNNAPPSSPSDTRTHAEESARQSNELSKAKYELLPNASTSSAPSGIGAQLEPVGKIHRATNSGR